MKQNKMSMIFRRAIVAAYVRPVLMIVGGLVVTLMFCGSFCWRRSCLSAKEDLTRTQIQNLSQKLEIFKLHCGAYPSDLAVLLKKPADGSGAIASGWKGPYIEARDLLDLWDQSFEYKFPGSGNPKLFDLWSHGRDRQSGTEDDIRG